jgi:hypothetical protein
LQAPGGCREFLAVVLVLGGFGFTQAVFVPDGLVGSGVYGLVSGAVEWA